MPLNWKIDECSSYFDRMRLRGWCFVPGEKIVAVDAVFPAHPEPVRLRSYGLPSPDVAAAIHPAADLARFDEWVPLPAAQRGRDFTLRIHLADGTAIETSSVHENARAGVVLELNRVLVPGGLVFINTPQTWPLHDEPWDFWRFSIHAWPALFNPMTGFEIVEVAQGEPARIHALWDSPVARDMPDSPAFLGSNVIARKVGDTSLDWPVPTALACSGSYPAGELAVAPH